MKATSATLEITLTKLNLKTTFNTAYLVVTAEMLLLERYLSSSSCLQLVDVFALSSNQPPGVIRREVELVHHEVRQVIRR